MGALALLGWTVWLLVPARKPPAPLPEVQRTLLTLLEGRLHLVGATNAFTGWMIETNAQGGLRSRSSISNGLLEGASEGYHTNGQRQVLEHFRAGTSHGPRTKWYPNGRKASETQVADGKLEGLFVRWAEDGSLAEEIPMKDGQPDGLSRSYYPSGCVKAEALMKGGKLVEQHFWPDGERRLPPPKTNRPVPP